MKTILTIILSISIIIGAVVIYRRVSIVRGGFVTVWSRKDAAEKFRRELEDEYDRRGNGRDL